MSCIRLNIVDFSQTVSGEIHGSLGDAAIAALSAEPETIRELELAVTRFIKLTEGWTPFASFSRGANFESYDAGIVVIDLAARIVMLDSTYSAPTRIQDSDDDELDIISAKGAQERPARAPVDETPSLPAGRNGASAERQPPPTYVIRYHNGQHLTDICLPYRLPEDWVFVHSIPEYEGSVKQRRAHRERIKWRDPRAVLFGKPLTRFLAEAVLAADELKADGLFTKIHLRWLSTSRDDLGGKSPRELMLEKQDFIDFDLHSREMQWSLSGECPPALLRNCHAYRYAGMGTHEIVLYYDMIRWLLADSREHVLKDGRTSVADETERLDRVKNFWLEAHDHEHQGKAPAQVIEWERRRIPLAISGKDAMVDKDCPICQAMAEDLDPYFWHLDGSAMDDCFEFSFHQTREQWEEERRSWEEFRRKFARTEAEEKTAARRDVRN